MTPVDGEDGRGAGGQPPPLPRRRLGRPYWGLVAATGTSGLGNGLVAVALPLLAYSLTHRPLSIAAVAAAERIPWLLTSLPAGALADRLDRRRLAATVEVLRALLLAVMSVVILRGGISMPIVYLAAFVLGALETAFGAATRAVLPTVVASDDLVSANSYLFTAETAGEQFAGPALGGVLYGTVRALPFLGDAVSFAGSAALLAATLPPDGPSNPPSNRTLTADIREGLRWFRQSRLLRRLAPVVAGLAFCQAAVMSIIVIYDLHVLGLSAAEYGYFLAAASVGDVAGSLLAGRTHARLGSARSISAAGVSAAAGYLVLASTAAVPVALIGYTLEAVAIALGNVATVSLRQKVIPTELFGRVNNAFRTVVFGVVPVGALLGGLCAAAVGVQATFLVAGVVQLVLVAGTWRRLAAEIARIARPGA